MIDIDDALELAVHLHRGHYRNDGEMPYVTHLIEVYKSVHEYKQEGVNQNVLEAAALMHDSYEDKRVSLEDLAYLLNTGREGLQAMMMNLRMAEPKERPETPKVIKVVDEVSMPPDDKFNRLQKYEWLEGFAEKSFEAIVLKIADRVRNVRDFQVAGKMEYAGKYALQAMPVYQAFLSHVKNNQLMMSRQIQKDMRFLQSAVDYRWPGKFRLAAEASPEHMDEIKGLVTS